MSFSFYTEREWLPSLAPVVGIAALLFGVAWRIVRSKRKAQNRRVFVELIEVVVAYTVLPAAILVFIPVAAYSGRHMGNIFGIFWVLPLHVLFVVIGFLVALFLHVEKRRANKLVEATPLEPAENREP